MISFIPAKGSIVVSLEVVLIKLDGLCVVSNGRIKVALLAISETAVMIEVGLARFNLNCRCEALDGIDEVTAPVQRYSLIVVSVRVFRVYLDRCGVVLDGLSELAKLVICETSVEERFKMVRVNF